MQPRTYTSGQPAASTFLSLGLEAISITFLSRLRPIRKLRTAYCENVELVIEEVRSLLEALDGKTVVSADHGEMFGERHFPIPVRDYMHPHGIDNDVLTKVPWQVLPADERRRIIAEQPSDKQGEVDADAVEEHLRGLGYLQ